MRQSDQLSGFLCGLRESVTISLAGGLFGFVFGLLAIAHGLSGTQATMMSVFVYSGTAQILSLGVLTQNSFSILSLLMMVLAICSRYFLMGVTIRPHIKQASVKAKLVSLFTLMDENWALTLLKGRQNFSAEFIFGYFCGSGLLAYFVWVGCTILGVMLSTYIHHPQTLNLDFIFSALFLALLVSSWRGKHELLPWIISLILALLFKHYLPGNWNIIFAALAASGFGVWYESSCKN